VVVLNVDLLPNNTYTIVIGDRLFSLSIQVEGREDEAAYDNQMEVDDGKNGDDGAEQRERKKG
jgi:hypothetical protein